MTASLLTPFRIHVVWILYCNSCIDSLVSVQGQFEMLVWPYIKCCYWYWHIHTQKHSDIRVHTIVQNSTPPFVVSCLQFALVSIQINSHLSKVYNSIIGPKYIHCTDMKSHAHGKVLPLLSDRPTLKQSENFDSGKFELTQRLPSSFKSKHRDVGSCVYTRALSALPTLLSTLVQILPD